MFSNDSRCIYHNNQLSDVICQLRFPEILSINTTPPAQFQEAIRDEYQKFTQKMDTPAPKLVGTPGNLTLQNQPGIMNYQFSTADGAWRINLTSRFISLSCSRYTRWEYFAKKLDKPLAAFIQIYKPAFFERVGLRYINFISKRRLSLEDTPFNQLLQPEYLGILGDEQITEKTTTRSSVDADFAIRGDCRAKIHAGVGMIKRNGVSDNEIIYIFDQDLYINGNIAVNYSAGSLQTLHSQAYSIFRGAITDTLHDAMDPEEI